MVLRKGTEDEQEWVMMMMMTMMDEADIGPHTFINRLPGTFPLSHRRCCHRRTIAFQ